MLCEHACTLNVRTSDDLHSICRVTMHGGLATENTLKKCKLGAIQAA